MRRYWKTGCILIMIILLLTGCTAGSGNAEETGSLTGSESTEAEQETESALKEVYFLNSRPDLQELWTKLADAYKKETGITVKITAVEPQSYEAVLETAMKDENPPALFDVSSLAELEAWEKDCYDLKDTDIFEEQGTDTSRFIRRDGLVTCVGYSSGSFGLIYNKAILEEYCAREDALIFSAEEITDFSILKAVAEDIQDKKGELGIKGAFASAGKSTSWMPGAAQFLINFPVIYEERDKALSQEGECLECLGDFYELYVDNATCTPDQLTEKSAADGAVEFAFGEAAFYLGGTWMYQKLSGNVLADGDMGILPIYMGVEGEEAWGLCRGYRSYLCVNKNASQEAIGASLEFLDWMLTDGTGKEILALEDEVFNPLLEDAKLYEDKGNTAWRMMAVSSAAWLSELEDALIRYAAGEGSWAEVREAYGM